MANESVTEALEIFNAIKNLGSLDTMLPVYNTLIHGLIQNNRLAELEQVLREVDNRDLLMNIVHCYLTGEESRGFQHRIPILSIDDSIVYKKGKGAVEKERRTKRYEEEILEKLGTSGIQLAREMPVQEYKKLDEEYEKKKKQREEYEKKKEIYGQEDRKKIRVMNAKRANKWTNATIQEKKSVHEKKTTIG